MFLAPDLFGSFYQSEFSSYDLSLYLYLCSARECVRVRRRTGRHAAAPTHAARRLLRAARHLGIRAQCHGTGTVDRMAQEVYCTPKINNDSANRESFFTLKRSSCSGRVKISCGTPYYLLVLLFSHLTSISERRRWSFVSAAFRHRVARRLSDRLARRLAARIAVAVPQTRQRISLVRDRLHGGGKICRTKICPRVCRTKI